MAMNYQVMYHLSSSQLPAQRATVLAGVGATVQAGQVWATTNIKGPGATTAVWTLASMVCWQTSNVNHNWKSQHVWVSCEPPLIWATFVNHSKQGPQQ